MRYIDHKTLAAICEHVSLPWMKLEDGKRNARLVNQHAGNFVLLANILQIIVPHEMPSPPLCAS